MPGLLDLIAARNPEQARGLLSDLVAAPRNRLRGLLDNPIGFANDALQEGLFGPPEVRAARDKFWNKEPMTEWEKQAYTNQLLNMGMGGLTVYHGSPHKFDKFDMSKIGTGEGAQAYGHGLYFAESPEIAKNYRDSLSRVSQSGQSKAEYFVDGVKADLPESTSAKAVHYAAARGQLDDFVKVWKDMPDSAIKRKFMAQVAELRGKKVEEKFPTGALYKVDLPDESIAKMLDWDKPLSQQADGVTQSIVAAMRPKVSVMPNGEMFSVNGITPIVSNHATESEAVAEMQRRINSYGRVKAESLSKAETAWKDLVKQYGSPEKASEALKSQGIPGIRYLDGGSRNAGQGTYNYVVFDDALPTILERNGQKLK